MKFIYITTALLFLINTTLFSQNDSNKNTKTVSNKSTNQSNNSDKDLALKTKIHAYSQVLTTEDIQTGQVYCFEFSSYDNPISLDYFNSFMQNQNILKFCPTKSTFAIKTNASFNKEFVSATAKKFGLVVKEITIEQYLVSKDSNK